jgi:integrase
MMTWTGRWKGGRTTASKERPVVWVIEKQIHKVPYTITLESRTEEEALGELNLFKRDPAGYYARYNASQGPSDEPVYLNEALFGKYLRYLRDEQADGKEGPNARSLRHRKNVRNYLAQWTEVLHGQDLRTLTLKRIKGALTSWPTARRHRISALKGLYTWLREECAELTPGEDPTLALKTPQPAPEKVIRVKGYPVEVVSRVYAKLTSWSFTRASFGTRAVSPLQEEEIRTLAASGKSGYSLAKEYKISRNTIRGILTGAGRKARREDKDADAQCVRDVFVLAAKGGMHLTEIDRIAKGQAHVKVLHNQGEIAATITYKQKTGVHVKSIDGQMLASVRRLQKRGAAPASWWVRRVVGKACAAVNEEPLNLGEFRHSFITWAAEEGVPVSPKAGGVALNRIAAVVNHRSALTTSKFYDNRQVPEMICIPSLNLVHPDDPDGSDRDAPDLERRLSR